MAGCFGIAAIARVSRKALGILLLGIIPLAVAGCMKIETVVRVNPDGSGTITERLVMSNQFIGMVKEMAPGGAPIELYTEQGLRDATPGYGEGVTYVSTKDVATEFGKGYEVRYAFTDINKIRIGQDPVDKMPGDGNMQGKMETDGRDFTTFTMRPGKPGELVIHWPVDENGPGTEEAGEEPSTEEIQSPERREAAMEMMKAVFQDLRMSMHVEVAGRIVESSATHRDGNRVTLIDIAFADILGSEEAMQAMASNRDQSVADMKEMMALIPGLKLEIEPEVKVRFE